jgi:hypothetical protein
MIAAGKNMMIAAGKNVFLELLQVLNKQSGF